MRLALNLAEELPVTKDGGQTSRAILYEVRASIWVERRSFIQQSLCIYNVWCLFSITLYMNRRYERNIRRIESHVYRLFNTERAYLIAAIRVYSTSGVRCGLWEGFLGTTKGQIGIIIIFLVFSTKGPQRSPLLHTIFWRQILLNIRTFWREMRMLLTEVYFSLLPASSISLCVGRFQLELQM